MSVKHQDRSALDDRGALLQAWPMARVLVTGATGFIGQNVVRASAERKDHTLRCLVRRSSDVETIVEAGAELVYGDIGDIDSLRAAVDGVDVVLHLASLLKVPWREEFHRVNVEGARNVARACAERASPPVLVVVSSLAAAGPSPADTPKSEADPAQPVSIYGRVKLASEQAALELADRVPISVVRPPMVFGDADRSALKLFRSVASGWHVVPSRKTHRLSMIHARDLAELLFAVAEQGERVRPGALDGRGLYYAAHDERPSYAELGLWIAEAMRAPKPRILRLPESLSWTAALGAEIVARLRDQPSLFNLDKFREATAGSWTCSGGKAQTQLKFRPEPVSERLAETAAWYRARGWLAEM